MSDVATRPRPRLGVGAACALAAVLALGPVVRMAGLVRDASRLQYSDYWLLIPHYVNHDGSLHVSGLFDFQFQNHPVVVPMLVYWLNMRLFAGSNVTLGVVVLILGVALVGMVALLAARTELRLGARLALPVLASCLLFTRMSTWNFVISMSGTAWLGAGLLGVVALYQRSRDRPVVAFGLAVVGAFTYATGLMLWPAVAAVGACRRPLREWWREWPFAAGFVANFLWYRQVQTSGLAADLPFPGPREAIKVVARLLVFPLGIDGTAATVTGLVVLGAIVALVIWFAVSPDGGAAAAWVGVAVFGLGGTASLATGRYDWLAGHGDQNRYSSVPSVALIGLAGLLLLAAHRLLDGRRPPGGVGLVLVPLLRAAPLGLLAIAAVLTTTSGAEHAARMRSIVPDQDLREIALRLDLVDGTNYLAGFPTTVTDLLDDIGHYPFVDSWDRDCGLIDQVLQDTGEAAGEIGSAQRVDRLDGAWELRGRVDDQRPVRCVVYADLSGRVIGASTLAADDAGTDFIGIARPTRDPIRVLVVFEDSPVPQELGVTPPDDVAPG